MENPQNKGNYKRFKHGESGDTLHFIGKEFELSDFNGACWQLSAIDSRIY